MLEWVGGPLGGAVAVGGRWRLPLEGG